MHATGTYTTAETPNHMETTRILAPKWLITRNRRPSPENATNIPDFREKIQGFILIQRARVDPARHTRTRSDTMFALVTSSAAVRANAPAQFKRNVSARCVSSDARRDARSRDAGRRDDATRDFARWAPLCVTRARARGRARDARANATRRASAREKYGGATRARAGRGASRGKFSRRRRRGDDAAATSTMLTRMTRMTRTASSKSREDGREGSTTSRRREKIRTAED